MESKLFYLKNEGYTSLIVGTSGLGKSRLLEQYAAQQGISYEEAERRSLPSKDVPELRNKAEKIAVNIWDDYYDDGYVPAGKVQETYAYVEGNLPNEDCKEILSNLMVEIGKHIGENTNLKCTLEFYDSEKVYPNLVGTEHAWCLYKRWQLQLENLSHEMREKLVDELVSWNYQHKSTPVVVHSES